MASTKLNKRFSSLGTLHKNNMLTISSKPNMYYVLKHNGDTSLLFQEDR